MRAHMQLSPVAIIAAPAPLPAWLDGLGASEDQLRDWGWAGHVGEGSWPIVETREPFDPETETEIGPVVTIDEAQGTVTHAYGKRDLTPEEIEARRPPPQVMSKMQFIRLVQVSGGMTDALLAQADAEPLLKPFWIKFNMTSEMQRDDVDTQAGLGALEALGLLPNGATAVIAAWPRS